MGCRSYPVVDMEATGKNIKSMREQAGMTIRDIQNIFGFSTPQAVYRWEYGKTIPCIDNMVVLASVFGVKIDDIIVCI